MMQKSSGLPPWSQKGKSSPCFQQARQLLPKVGPFRAVGLNPAQQSSGGKTTTPVGLESEPSAAMGLQRALSQRELFSSLKISWNLPGWVLNLLGTHLPSFQCPPFGMGMSILFLFCCCSLDAHNLSDLMGSHLERSFAFFQKLEYSCFTIFC